MLLFQHISRYGCFLSLAVVLGHCLFNPAYACTKTDCANSLPGITQVEQLMAQEQRDYQASEQQLADTYTQAVQRIVRNKLLAIADTPREQLIDIAEESERLATVSAVFLSISRIREATRTMHSCA